MYIHLNMLIQSLASIHSLSSTCMESPCSSSCIISLCVRVQCSSSVGGYLGEIGDICWVERLANMVASHMLAICPTPFERGHLLKLLNDGTFGQGFQCSGKSWFLILWRAATCIQTYIQTLNMHWNIELLWCTCTCTHNPRLHVHVHVYSSIIGQCSPCVPSLLLSYTYRPELQEPPSDEWGVEWGWTANGCSIHHQRTLHSHPWSQVSGWGAD